ncbi:MAG: ATP-binding protein [Thermodesulfobacteriota bacterium]
MMVRPDLELIRDRIRQKRANYIKYDFTRIQNDLLKTFFDLAQEFDTLRDFFRICVSLPLEFINVESALYLVDEGRDELVLVCSSLEGVRDDRPPAPAGIALAAESYRTGDSYVVPVHGKRLVAGDMPLFEKDRVIGMFELFPSSRLTGSDRFFLTKYTNRIGFNLHNRIISRQNIRHLKFINSLVRDIEHDVIVPNMYYKYLFRQLRKRITEIAALEQQMDEEPATGLAEIRTRLAGVHQDLSSLYEELQKHHANISLFLESLFRRDHFEAGHLVLRPRTCIVGKEIVEPQLSHYLKRFEGRGIAVEYAAEMAQEEVALSVDIGLLSQVYANLFSNALKYTETILDRWGQPRKTVSYGREYHRHYFGPNKDGIKFNVFTTGRHLSPDEGVAVFSEGVRGSNCGVEPGTGHGLSFVKHVIEMHGGRVGYEPTEQGNNFYFVLPLSTMPLTE